MVLLKPFLSFLLFFGSLFVILARPQQPTTQNDASASPDERENLVEGDDENFGPVPYNYKYAVANRPTKTFFGQNEDNGEGSGAVKGKYYVWLADGRLMTVEYSVDGKSGFVPRISYQNNAQPFNATIDTSGDTNLS